MVQHSKFQLKHVLVVEKCYAKEKPFLKWRPVGGIKGNVVAAAES